MKNSATGTWFQTPEAYGFYESLPELFTPFVVGVASPKPSPKGKGEQPPSGSALKGRVGVRPLLRALCVGYVTKEKSRLKQFFTRRAIIIGGPVIADDASSEETEALMRAVVESVGCKVYNTHYTFNITQNFSSPIYIETRNFNDYSQWRGTFEKVGFEYKKHLNFHVDTSSAEVVESNLGKSRKRDIRTTIREGVSVVTIGDLSFVNGDCKSQIDDLERERLVREYYGILEKLYKTKVKTPLFPVEFFLELSKQKDARFLLTEYQGHIIGGTVCVMQEGRCLYEWFACGEDGVYPHVFPSCYETYAGIKYAAEHGCARFDMMGAGTPDAAYGVREFKAKFGGKEVEHGRFICVTKPILYQIGKFGVWLLKRVSG